MCGISKTLSEMTLVERFRLIETIAAALEATADKAREDGDARFVSSSTRIAKTIRDMSCDLSPCDVPAAELLLEKGIMLVHHFSTRKQVATLN
jgi:hypothetical protein